MTLPEEFKLFLRGWRFKLKKMSERVRFAECSSFWIYKILANLRDLYKRHEYRLFIFCRLTQCILVFSGLGHRWEFFYALVFRWRILVFFIPSMIFGAKLHKWFRRMKQEEYFDEVALGVNRSGQFYNEYGSRRTHSYHNPPPYNPHFIKSSPSWRW
jgi:hypothetical protein